MTSSTSKSVTCPRCHTSVPLGHPRFPFCSERCKLLDLGEWLSERNAVEVRQAEEQGLVPPADQKPDPKP